LVPAGLRTSIGHRLLDFFSQLPEMGSQVFVKLALLLVGRASGNLIRKIGFFALAFISSMVPSPRCLQSRRGQPLAQLGGGFILPRFPQHGLSFSTWRQLSSSLAEFFGFLGKAF
jgi:hypothetical protein